MAAVCPAGPDPMMTTLWSAGWLIALFLHGRCLERCPPVLHVDAELDALAGVTRHELIAVLAQRLGELLEREAVGGLAALLLRADEILERRDPLDRFFRGPAAFSRRLGHQLGGDRADHRRLVVGLVLNGGGQRRSGTRQRRWRPWPTRGRDLRTKAGRRGRGRNRRRTLPGVAARARR